MNNINYFLCAVLKWNILHLHGLLNKCFKIHFDIDPFFDILGN